MNAQTSRPQSNVALVCDWLTTPGGAEKVLLELHKMYPDAPIYTSQYRPKKINWFTDAKVKAGWLNLFPACFRKILGPLRQLYFSHLNLEKYDLVISVTGAEAKAVRARRHLCYCHVPTQYYWQKYDDYVKNPGFGVFNPLVRTVFKLLVAPLRHADYKSAQRPDLFIAISTYAREQIANFYQREAIIVAPPVEIAKFSTIKSTELSTDKSTFSTRNPQEIHKKSTKIPDFSTTFPQFFHNQQGTFPQKPFVIACRQVTWKRVDLAISACKLAKVPLVVIGDGPEHTHLQTLADNSEYIAFLPWQTTENLVHYLQNARAFLFPSEEPFGIAPVEALAAGCPVIAYAKGGSHDFIKSGQNGLFFAEPTPESLQKTLQKFAKLTWNPQTIRNSAKLYDAKHFRNDIKAITEVFQ